MDEDKLHDNLREENKKSSDEEPLLSNMKNGSIQTAKEKNEVKGNKNNRIAFWGLIVNAILMIFTGGLFLLNRQGINAAIKASNVADSTFKISQKQFEIDNTPYLQVYDINLHFLDKGTDTVTYLIKSLGKNPVKTIAYTAYVQLYTKKRGLYLVGDIDSSIFKAISIKTTRYISEENPLDLSLPTYADYFVGKRLDSIRNGDLSLFFLGKIIYYNPETRRPRSYIFQAQLFPSFKGKKLVSKVKYFFTYNENEDIPDDWLMVLVPIPSKN